MGYIYLFIFMSALLVIMPGPDTGLATQNTLAHGRKGGILTVFGITSGLVIHTLAAVFGLSAKENRVIAKAFLPIFSIQKWPYSFLRSCHNF